MKESDNCRRIMYKYLEAYPLLRVYLKVAKFEEKHKNYKAAREIYEQVLVDLGKDALEEMYFITYAKFEIRAKQIDRAREIFKYGLENLPKDSARKLYDIYLNFEKQYGKKEEIDLLVFEKRRSHYKDLIGDNRLNYDAWFDLTNLEQTTKDIDRIRTTYKAAVENLPPSNEKRFWRRYIYLYLNWAVWEELEAKDPEAAKKVYERALAVIPHKLFSFEKVWIYFA